MEYWELGREGLEDSSFIAESMIVLAEEGSSEEEASAE